MGKTSYGVCCIGNDKYLSIDDVICFCGSICDTTWSDFCVSYCGCDFCISECVNVI